jgi:hypothetical protein
VIDQLWPLVPAVVVVFALAIRVFWRFGKGPWDVS